MMLQAYSMDTQGSSSVVLGITLCCGSSVHAVTMNNTPWLAWTHLAACASYLHEPGPTVK